MTCAPTPEANVLIRATARLVTDGEEAKRLWADGVLPYDPANFFQGPEDPETQFVELIPTSATVAAARSGLAPALATRRGSGPGRAPPAAPS